MVRLLLIIILLSLGVAVSVQAQTCQLTQSADGQAFVDALTRGKFLPGGEDGELVVRRKQSECASVRVFETGTPSPGAWNVLSQASVVSAKPLSDKPVEGCLPTDSSA